MTSFGVLTAYVISVPGIGSSFGVPVVTMISAGEVLTKIVGISAADNRRPGICLRTAAKFSSAGNDENAAGSDVTGAHLPLTSDAASHAPLLSQYHVLVPSSTNTSQFVFTAAESDVPVTGASTGSPSNTSKLAGRAL